MNLQVIERTRIEPARWDTFVVQCAEAWLYHLSDWIELEPGIPRSFAVESDGAIVAICPCYVGRRKYAGLVPSTVLHTGRARSGPAVDTSLSGKQRRAVQDCLMDHLQAVAARHGANSLEIRLPTLAPQYLPPLRGHMSPLDAMAPFSRLRYERSLHSSAPTTRVLSLEKADEALWTGLDQVCRTSIRKAQRADVTVSEVVDQQQVAVHHQLHLETCARTGAAPEPQDRLLQLWTRLAPSRRACLYMASHAGRVVASLMVLRMKSAATYWAGGSSYAAQHLRPNNLLMWHAILSAKQEGAVWFELGPTFTTAPPESKQRRIGHFKTQFGGEDFAMYEGIRHFRPGRVLALELLDIGAGAVRERWRRRDRENS